MMIQSEVKDLFNKFISFREETHKQCSTIINAHSINKGIHDLVEEVFQLQAQVSIITKERNVLLETISNLNCEIRQLNSKIPVCDALSEAEETLNDSEEDNSDTNVHFVERNTIPNENHNEDESVRCDDVEDETSLSHDKQPLNDRVHTYNLEDVDMEEKNGNYGEADEDKMNGTETKQSESKCNKEKNIDCHEKDSVCQECNFAFSNNENLTIHLKNFHSDMEMSRDDSSVNQGESGTPLGNSRITKCKTAIGYKEEQGLLLHRDSVHKSGKQKFNCEHCPYSTFIKSSLKRHTNIVHKKIKKHICEECGYGGYQKSDLDYHMVSAHGKGGKKFKCKKCSYSSAKKYNLVQHKDAVHEKIKNHACSECDYAASLKRSLKQHMESVHEKIKNHACSECDYAATRKDTLRQHMESVHEKIKNHACSECDYAATRKDTLKRHMESVHRMGGEKLKSE